jgi:signal transduction histidine kinase
VWVKLRIQPRSIPPSEAQGVSTSDSAVVLRVGLLSLDRIELFEQVDGTWLMQRRGDTIKEKYAACRDDVHCFELRSNPQQAIDMYLKIKTNNITTVELQAVTVKDLTPLVADRMVELVSTLSVAAALLAIGILFFVIERSHLVATFCLYQSVVVLAIFFTSGLVRGVLENSSPEVLNSINQYILNLRAMVSVLLSYVVLRSYKLHALYHQAMWVLVGMGVLSAYYVAVGDIFNAVRLNIAIYVINFAVQILGVATAKGMTRVLRYITFIGYVVFEIILVGSIFTAFNLDIDFGRFTPIFMQSMGDSRMNGSRVGLFLFAILIVQLFERRKINSDTLESFKLEAAKSSAQRERLIERQSMIDMLTHELKNPLGTIRFALASLKRKSSDDPDAQQRVKHIDDSVDRMNQLIEHVALSNKIDRFDASQVTETIDIAELVGVTIGDYDDIEIFNVDIEPDLKVQTSRLMLSLIVQNLISNAYKYHLTSDTVCIKAYADQGYMSIVFSNTVELEKSPDPERLFQAYYRHDYVQAQPGMGLGLSLCMSAAEKIHATIRFSQQKNLVVFTLQVPL